ncbi:ataxin-10 [Hyperolius riggenbachi]|uniref:ataxin-10 n=1 Tax=Hyperolius riggenbachi TaxID=752182 RepID=UPI0035A3D5E2
MAAPVQRLAAELEGGAAAAPEVLRRLAGLFREAEHREDADEKLFSILRRLLAEASGGVQTEAEATDASPSPWCDLSAECFRCLRNACVQCARNQNAIRKAGLIEESVSLMTVFSSIGDPAEPCLAAFRCGLQFLGNVAGGNQDSQNSIWNVAFPQLFLSCLTHSDEKVVAYSSMVLFTCMGEDKMADVTAPGNLSLAACVVATYSKRTDIEWLQLIVTERFLRYPDLVRQIYSSLSHSDRVTLLELLMVKMSETGPLGTEQLASVQAVAEFLSECFQNQCRSVLSLASPGHCDEQEAVVVIRLLDVLCELTSDNQHLTCLQNYPGLLEMAVETLRLTHLAGKQSRNIFTSTHSASLGQDLTHAAVGFKAHLIRLIANLCYRNRDNQDRIYELDGLPLILDNCTIDDNNPFLNQWAVYAIRNLTEHNERNQELIASLERQGLADTSVLERMGLHVDERDGKLVLKSTKKM